MHVMEKCLSEGFLDREDLLQVVKCPMRGQYQGIDFLLS